jgi:hypothetical protein
MYVVLNSLLTSPVNWKLVLIHGKPALIPQEERTVVIVQTLIGNRLVEICRVLSVHAHETQDAGPAACVRALVRGYTSIKSFGLRLIQAKTALDGIDGIVVDRNVVSHSSTKVGQPIRAASVTEVNLDVARSFRAQFIKGVLKSFRFF